MLGPNGALALPLPSFPAACALRQDGLDRRRRELVSVSVGLLRGVLHLRGAELGAAAADGAPPSVRLAGWNARACDGAGERKEACVPTHGRTLEKSCRCPRTWSVIPFLRPVQGEREAVCAHVMHGLSRMAIVPRIPAMWQQDGARQVFTGQAEIALTKQARGALRNNIKNMRKNVKSSRKSHPHYVVLFFH